MGYHELILPSLILTLRRSQNIYVGCGEDPLKNSEHKHIGNIRTHTYDLTGHQLKKLIEALSALYEYCSKVV